jgi:hypothetical protein
VDAAPPIGRHGDSAIGAGSSREQCGATECALPEERITTLPLPDFLLNLV